MASSEADVDVAVVGGGIQGLVVLRELAAAGYATALVTREPLGGAQTLHSHGALISGSGLLTGGLGQVVQTVTAPYLRDLGVDLAEQRPSLLALPDEVVAQLAPVWQANGYEPELVDAAAVGVAGVDVQAPLRRVPGCSVDRGALVRALVAGLEERVVDGEVVGAVDGALVLRTAGGGQRRLRAGAIVVAAGCGTRAVLDRVAGGANELGERISHSTLHMVCLRAPAGVLPAIGALVAAGLLVVAHERAGPGKTGWGAAETTWLVTPADPDGVPTADAPADAVAPVDPAVVARGLEALTRLVPVLRDDDAPVRATVFAGYKQELDGQPAARTCELAHPRAGPSAAGGGAARSRAAGPPVVVALPSVLANAVPNARDAVALLRDRVGPRRARGAPEAAVGAPGAAGGVEVGRVHEDALGGWSGWAAFRRRWG